MRIGPSCLRKTVVRGTVILGGCISSLLGGQSQASIPPSMVPSDIEARLLLAHNRERALLGIPPLRWDPALAASAASYGPALEAEGRLEHSPRANRPTESENLLKGPRGVYTPEQMVGNWAEEKAQFKPGVFPYVSSSDNWLDVSHYTQMIWRGTTSVGCAIHSGEQSDYLICRYTPKGNRDGQRVP